jgi:hypothetical protein
MGIASYVSEGLGNPAAYATSQHGAGRAMSRTAAPQVEDPAEVYDEMAGLGVALLSGDLATVAEEAASAYSSRQRSLLGDLPDVASGIAEARGPDAPWAIHRSVQERHSTRRQLRAYGIDAVDVDRELKAGSRVGSADLCRPDEAWRLGRDSRLISVFPKLNTAEASSS